MNVVCIGQPTEKEREEYERYKAALKKEAQSDKEKQTIKKVKHIIAVNGIRAGICPTCGHCLVFCDTECDECFQKVRWFGQEDE